MITPDDKKLLQFLAIEGSHYDGDLENIPESQLEHLDSNWMVDRYRDNNGYAIVSITKTGRVWLKAQENES